MNFRCSASAPYDWMDMGTIFTPCGKNTGGRDGDRLAYSSAVGIEIWRT